jgi:hypothetical protein
MTFDDAEHEHARAMCGLPARDFALLPENARTKLEVYEQLRQMHSRLKSIPDREDAFEQCAIDAVHGVLYLAENVFAKDEEAGEWQTRRWFSFEAWADANGWDQGDCAESYEQARKIWNAALELIPESEEQPPEPAPLSAERQKEAQ